MIDILRIVSVYRIRKKECLRQRNPAGMRDFFVKVVDETWETGRICCVAHAFSKQNDENVEL